jgi:hypothetical protein
MGRLVVTEFMTLDGVMEAPGFEEHRDGKNAWAVQATTEDQQRYKVDEIFAAGAILLGRVTYQIWAAFWPDAPRDAGFADRINGIEKYVVSTTLREQTWNNTTVIRSDLAGPDGRVRRRRGYAVDARHGGRVGGCAPERRGAIPRRQRTRRGLGGARPGARGVLPPTS